MNPILTPIGDRPLSLAGHLRHVASLIHNGSVAYDWKDCNACNCGLLARSIMGITRTQLRELTEPVSAKLRAQGFEHTGQWRLLADFCPLNPGVEAPELFKGLLAAGLIQSDFGHLEHLSHQEILAATPRRTKIETTTRKVKTGWFSSREETDTQVSSVPVAHNNGTDVGHYCLAWAGLIETYRAAHPETNDAALDAVETRPLVTT